MIGLYFVAQPYLVQTVFPVGWDTRRYVLGLISARYSGWSGVMVSSPFRFGYYLPESLISSALNLDPFQSEIVFPVILAACIPPLFYMATKQITHQTFAGIIAGILGVAWRGQTRLARDLHSNLLFFDLILLIGITFASYFTKMHSVRMAVMLTSILIILLTYSLIVYPLSFFLLLIPFIMLLRSAVLAKRSRDLSVTKFLKANYTLVFTILIPVLAFSGIFLVALRPSATGSSSAVITGDAGSLFSPPSAASLQLLNPTSSTFVLTDGWTGYVGPSLPSFDAIVSLILSFFAIAGVIFVAARSLRGKESPQKKIFLYYFLFSIVFVGLLLSASFVGISVPPDRALNDLALPLFSALGISWLISISGRHFQERKSADLSATFLVLGLILVVWLIEFRGITRSSSELTAAIYLLSLGIIGCAWILSTLRSTTRFFDPNNVLKIVAICVIMLALGSSLLPYNQSYSATGNQTMYFSTPDYAEVNATKAWLSQHSAPTPYIILDNATDDPNYVQIHVEVTQTYFGSTSTLVYFGDIASLVAANYTYFSNPTSLALSQYYFQILSQTPSYENGTVILFSFLYSATNQSGVNLTSTGYGSYVFNLKSAREQGV